VVAQSTASGQDEAGSPAVGSCVILSRRAEMVLFWNNARFTEKPYLHEEDFEKDIVENAKLFFGARTVYIDTKRKLFSKALGNTVPDGFLFDLTDAENPEFYIVEAELKSHDFYSHIFPQITKFFAFFKNYETRKELVEKLYTVVTNDGNLEQQFKKLMKGTELYKLFSDTLENSQNILLVIDGQKSELPEIMNTYTDTWGKMVRLQVIAKYVNDTEAIFTVDPEFEAVEYSLLPEAGTAEEGLEISEEFHLEGVSDTVKETYRRLKDDLHKINPNLKFNPQKYYISVRTNKNVVYQKIRKQKIRLIVMLPESVIRANVKKHNVKSLSASVQNFYNGECAAVDIENSDNLSEVVELVRPLVGEVGKEDA
jgi:predicted transport protein